MTTATRLRRTSAGLVMMLMAVLAPHASAQSDSTAARMDTALRHRAAQLTGRSRVIVQFRDAVDVRVLGRDATTSRRLNARTQVAEVSNRDLAALAADPRVGRVTLDRPVFATLERTGLATGATGARAQFGLSGRGVGVAVIDSGVDAGHEDFRTLGSWRQSSVAHFKDFSNQTGTVWTNRPYDDFGHGTHVSGIIAGDGSASGGRHTGVAPGASLVSLKVLDAEGHGYISDVIAAIDYAIAVRSAYNIRVINLSVGAGVLESYWLDPLTLAARRAVDAGIVVVAAAGNLGLDANSQPQWGGITAPGNAPWVLTVGAASHQGTNPRSDDIVGGFSSSGPTWIDFAAKPDVLAYGVGIVSAASTHSTLAEVWPDYLIAGRHDGGRPSYLSLSGTSMAAPEVAGAVALMLEANPSLTPNAVKAILQYTAQERPDLSPLAQGAGLLNVMGALRLARFFGTPVGGLDAMGDTIEGEWVAWSRQIIWGNYRVTGGVPLPGSSAWQNGLVWGALGAKPGTPVVWGARAGDNIVWSTALDDDDNIVWSTARADGDNIVWSTGLATDDNIVWSTARDENIVWSTARGDNIVWSTALATDDNIVWSTARDENIVWSTARGDNIVWSTATADNIVWSTDCGGLNCPQVVWGAQADGGVWGTAGGDDNIVWSTAIDDLDNIVWSTAGDFGDNIVWSTGLDDNIVWSTGLDDNIVWSTARGDNIVWSTAAIQPVLWSAGGFDVR